MQNDEDKRMRSSRWRNSTSSSALAAAAVPPSVAPSWSSWDAAGEWAFARMPRCCSRSTCCVCDLPDPGLPTATTKYGHFELKYVLLWLRKRPAPPPAAIAVVS